MITIFNRKEVGLTDSMKQQALWREVLAREKISYVVKVVERTMPSVFSDPARARIGSYGQKPERSKEYRLYVKRTDSEKARHLILQARG